MARFSQKCTLADSSVRLIGAYLLLFLDVIVMFQLRKIARVSQDKGEELGRDMKRTKGQILCVEDDQDSADVMTVLLGMSGYEVITADSLAEAEKLARGGGFDLYLLDNWLKDGS